MGRIKYDDLKTTSGKIRNVNDVEVGDKVVLTTPQHGGGLSVTDLVVEKITKTTLTLTTKHGQKVVFTVSRAQFFEGDIRQRQDHTGYAGTPNLWAANDPNLAPYIEFFRQQKEISDLHDSARTAFSLANERYLTAERVEAAIAAGQAWLDATAEQRAEQAARDEAERVKSAAILARVEANRAAVSA